MMRVMSNLNSMGFAIGWLGALARIVPCFVFFIVIVFIVIAADAKGQNMEQVEIAARSAISDRLGGVFVVEIQASAQQRKSQVVRYAFDVVEVIKPYRNDSGTYFIPLYLNELSKDGKAAMLNGGKYVIVTGYRSAPFGWLYLDAYCEVSDETDEDDKLLQRLRELSDAKGVFGSSRYLDYDMRPPLGVLLSAEFRSPPGASPRVAARARSHRPPPDPSAT